MLNYDDYQEKDIQTQDQFTAVGDLLQKMQDSLQIIKETKTKKSELANEIQILTTKLAEAQAKEIRLSEELLDQNIEWQRLTQEFTAMRELDVSGS